MGANGEDLSVMSTAAFFSAFLGLFAMMNPIGNTGIFIGMTPGVSTAFKIKCAIKVSLVVLVILLVAIFGGMAILNAFGISLPAFELAGGLIVLGIGFKMLNGGENTAHATVGAKASIEDVSALEEKISSKMIVPLAMPILGGPGSITTVVTVAARYEDLEGSIGVAVGTTALVAIMMVCFMLSGYLAKILSEHAQEIIIRFMGLLLIAIATGMMLDGFEKSVLGFALAHESSLSEVIHGLSAGAEGSKK
jgi:multiple antibiotic resistance protein